MYRILFQLARTFAVLGSVSFGGYMSLIAMMREELVVRRKMISDETLTEGTALASILPGPVAVNVVAYAGYRMSGVLGALVSVIAVLLPSFILVLTLTIAYFQWGSEMEFESILNGVLPVVVAYILSVGYTMLKNSCKKQFHYIVVIVVAAVLLYKSSYFIILVLLACSALLGAVFFKKNIPSPGNTKPGMKVLYWIVPFCFMVAIAIQLTEPNILTQIFKTFSVVSLTLFGGGYVMVPMLQEILISKLHWVNQQEFVYGISIGQMTPGPILISALFFGYKVAGFYGGLLATIGIFLPSAILMVAISNIYLSFKSNKFVVGSMELIRPVVVGLIFYSGISLLLNELPLASQAVLFLLTAFFLLLIIRFKIKPIVLVPLGGLIGFLIF